MKTRPETGTMRFGADWTGVFVRGDNAFHYAMALSAALDQLEGQAPLLSVLLPLKGLLGVLMASDERGGAPPDQQLRPFFECLPP